MFVRSKIHKTLSDKYNDLWEKYAMCLKSQEQQAQLLHDAQQIFDAIPASRVSLTVREQIAEWRKGLTALNGETPEQSNGKEE
jgi:hypothetical protein